MKIIEMSFDALRSADVPVYFPGTHKGECTSPYAVIRKLSSSQYVTYSTDVHYMEVICCAPNISGCFELADKAKAGLRTIYPTVRSTRDVSEPYWSDTSRCWMVQLEYTYYKKIKEGV